MAWTVVEGTYRDGQVYLKQHINSHEALDVLVLIPERTPVVEQSHSWERLRQQFASEMPELRTMNAQDQRAEFDELSAQIADNLPYDSIEEFEQAMRGDSYGITRY